MDIQKISNEIATLKRAVKTAATASLKDKLKKKIANLNEVLKDANIPAKKLAMMLLGAKRKVASYTTAEFNAVIKRLSYKAEYTFLKGLTKVEIKDDLERNAKNPGWRFKGRNNFKTPTKKDLLNDMGKPYGKRKTYFERRSNRSDVTHPAKLVTGGGVNNDMAYFIIDNEAVDILLHENFKKYVDYQNLENGDVIYKMDRRNFERFEDLAYSTSQKYEDVIEEVNSDGSYMMAKGGGVESGLYVIGRTKEDNTKIGEMIEEQGYQAEWNAREGYWFFEEEKDLYDSLERDLEKQFAKYNINARFEGIFANGGGLEEEEFDLFEDFDNLPKDVQDIFFEYEEADDTYDRNQEMLGRLQPLGYTFDYGLDAIPFGLKKMKKGGTLTANDISKGTWLKNDSTKVLAKVWNVDPRLGMMQLEDVYGNRDTKFRYLAGWSLVKAPEKKLKEIKEEWAEMAKGGGVGKSKKQKGDIGKYTGKQYGYTLNEYEKAYNNIFVSPKDYWKKEEGSEYKDFIGRKQRISSTDEDRVMELYAYKIMIGIDLGSKKIPLSAKQYAEKIYLLKPNEIAAKLENGGGVGNENKEMVLNNAQQIEHHAEELENAAKKSKHVPAWVVAKVYNASSNISDATHYLEGVNTMPKEQFERIHEEIENHKMADGGGLNSFMDKQMHISKVCKNHGCSSKDYLNAKKKYGIGGTLLLAGLGVAGLIAYNNSKNPITEDEYKLKMYKKGTLQNTIIVDESYVNKATEDYKKLGYIVRVSKVKKMATGGGVDNEMLTTDLKVQRICPLCGKDSAIGINVGVTEKGDILQCDSRFSSSYAAKLLKPYKGKVKGMIIGKNCFKKHFNNSFENIDKIKAIHYY